jgi:hypothetical protein
VPSHRLSLLRVGVLRAAVIAVGLALPADGCVGRIEPQSSPDAAPASLRPGDTRAPIATAVTGDLPIDAASRDLIAFVSPDEAMTVRISTTWTAELHTAATAVGMTSVVGDDGGTIAIEGQLGEALDLARAVPVTAVRVEDLRAAFRPIPRDRPVVAAPQPGRPYLGIGFAGVLPNVTLAASQREPMLRGLAGAIETIDGRPYARLGLDGGCGATKGGASCRVNAIGFAAGSAGYEDDLSVVGTGAAGWAGIVEPASVLRRSVPRPLLRAAEWTARNDGGAVSRIAAYATCCLATWDPARPVAITLE